MVLLAVLLLAFITISHGNQCENVVYKQLDNTKLKPSQNNEIARVDITDNMKFSMDITVNSFPSGVWASVFHCGSTDGKRMPGIWLHPDSGTDGALHESFHISFSTVSNANPWKNPPTELVLGQTYNLEIIVTQNSYEILIDGNSEVKDDAYPNHNVLNNEPCYASNPWYVAADVIIENLQIIDVIQQSKPCCIECKNVLYSSGKYNAITPTQNNKLADIPITGYMMYSMDITIHSFPTGWASVFHCGENDGIRIPGIWLHPESDTFGRLHEGFHIAYSTTKASNPWLNPNSALLIDVKYELEILITPNRYTIFLDGEAVVNRNGDYDTHNIYDSQPCYSGDPWYPAADVTMENIKIISINPECENIYNPTPNKCNNAVYQQEDGTIIDPTKGNEIARINIGDTMTYSLDITVNSFPSGVWASVFHCGSSDGIRMPGIWLHPDSGTDGALHESFHISYSTVSNANPWQNPPTELVLGQTYNLELIVTQNSFEILIDGNSEFKDDNYANHNVLNNEPCYTSNPWYVAADVIIENLEIKEEVSQFTSCSNKCKNRLYTSGNEVIIPSQGNLIGVFPITGYMMYDMEITVNSFPTGWASVFHCGENDGIRMPGIWLHPDSDNFGALHEGFHVSYSTTTNNNPWSNPTGYLEIGEKYRFVMIVTPNKIAMWVNGKNVYNDNNYDTHNLYKEQPCYVSDPWYVPADVQIENMKIFSINANCQKAHDKECIVNKFKASSSNLNHIYQHRYHGQFYQIYETIKNMNNWYSIFIILALSLYLISKCIYDQNKNKSVQYAGISKYDPSSADDIEQRPINM